MKKKLVLIVLAAVALSAFSDNTFAFGGGHRGGGYYGRGCYDRGYYGGYYRYHRGFPHRWRPIIVFPLCGMNMCPTVCLDY